MKSWDRAAASADAWLVSVDPGATPAENLAPRIASWTGCP